MSLNQIALRHGTDKASNVHGYTSVYEKYFEPMRNMPITLLELGIGGYHYPDRGGESLKTWADYFHQAQICGIDIYDKSMFNGGRVKTFVCSQVDESGLNQVIQKIGAPDIIIDDASHINPLTIRAFQILWFFLKQGGVYVIEDVHTSYWEAIASDGTDFGGGTHPNTVMNFFKSLADSLHAEHSGVKDHYGIKSIHFYEKMIWIFKK